MASMGRRMYAQACESAEVGSTCLAMRRPYFRRNSSRFPLARGETSFLSAGHSFASAKMPFASFTSFFSLVSANALAASMFLPDFCEEDEK